MLAFKASRDSLPDSIWKRERVSVLALSVHPDRFETFLNVASFQLCLNLIFPYLINLDFLFFFYLLIVLFQLFCVGCISNFFLFAVTWLKNTIINPSKINIRFLIGNWRKSWSGENESERHLAATHSRSHSTSECMSL